MSKDFDTWISNQLTEMDEVMNGLEIVPKVVEEIEQNQEDGTNYDEQIEKLDYLFKRRHMMGYVESNEREAYIKIRSDLLKKAVKQTAEKYDKVAAKGSKKYVTFKDSIKDDKSLDPVDKELDNILEKKLEVYKETGTKASESMLKKLREQEEKENLRTQDHNARINAIKNLVKKNDSLKREQNSDYISFDENCDVNEEESAIDTENLTRRFKVNGINDIKDVEKQFLDGEIKEVGPNAKPFVISHDE